MSDQDLKVYFLNAGQGHCAFVKVPGGRDLLIDINHAKGAGIHVLNFLRDYIEDENGEFDCIIGHPDKDHCRGLKDIHSSSDLKIARMFDCTLRKEKEEGQEYREYDDYIDILGKLKKENKVISVKRSIDIDPALKFEWGGIRFFTPNQDYSSQKLNPEDMNRQSLLIQIDFYGTKILFASDTSFLTYKEDLKGWKDFSFSMLESKILLVSHHGSRTFFCNTKEEEAYMEALNAIAPEYAIISVGKDNPHDHPCKDSLELYKKKARVLYRTDEDGSVIVTCRKLGNGQVETDVNPDNTIDEKYKWNEDKSSSGNGPVILPSWKKSSPSVLGGNPKG
jgi:beta-lactamase superfamily II metal-dependent hydrolase